MPTLFGSICLSDIPRSQMKRVKTKDGREKVYLNVCIGQRRNPVEFGQRRYTHYVSCSPKKEERRDGENYFIGDLYAWEPRAEAPTPEDVASAPAADVAPWDNMDADIPF